MTVKLDTNNSTEDTKDILEAVDLVLNVDEEAKEPEQPLRGATGGLPKLEPDPPAPLQPAPPEPGSQETEPSPPEPAPAAAELPLTAAPEDDDALLAELYALIGDRAQPKPNPSPFAVPTTPPHAPPQRPAVRLTPDALKDVPEQYEDVAREDASGAPGWLKGLFILLISLLLGAMTFYAVAADVLGQVF